MTKTSVASLGNVEIFCRAAEKNSFTDAARSLGTTPSAVSKAVARLERHLGARLFQRSTRSIRLTDDGRSYYESCQQALELIGEAESRLHPSPSGPLGTLRLSLPLSYGIKRVMPIIPRYLDLYRGRVKVAVTFSNTLADFVHDDVDLSVQLGPVADSGLVARPLHESQFRVVASPGYLRAHGVPGHPRDLPDHDCIDLVYADTGRPFPWRFQVAGQTQEPPLSFRLVVDHPIAALAAAVGGAGFVRLLDFTVEAELQAGTLVEVLQDFRVPGQWVTALHPRARHVPERVRTFLEFLVDEIAATAAAPPALRRRPSLRG